MSRKILSLVLAVLLVFASAAVAEGTDDRITVTYWNLITGPDADTLNSIVEQYNNSQDEVYIDCYCWDWDDYYTKLRLAILSETGPDLALSHCDNIAALYAAGCCDCIETEFERLGVEYDFSTSVSPALESVKFDGHYYSVPQDVLAEVLVFNKGVYRELGLLDENDMPNFFGSMEDWNAAAAKVEENYEMFGTGLDVTSYGMTGIWLGFYYQLGGSTEWLGEDGLTCELDRDLAIQALGLLSETYSHNQVEGSGWDLFINQTAPISNIGTWSVGYAISSCEENGIELGICPMPALLNPDSKSEASWSHSLFLPKNPNRTDEVTKAALEFVVWFLDNNELWAQAGHLPANAASYETDFFKSLPLRDEYKDAPAHNQVFPSSPAVTLYTSSEFATPVEQYLRGELDSEAAVDTVIANLNSIFDAYRSGEQA